LQAKPPVEFSVVHRFNCEAVEVCYVASSGNHYVKLYILAEKNVPKINHISQIPHNAVPQFILAITYV